MKFRFDNITISGGVGVGKSTLIDNLIPYLSPYGWQFKSLGDIHRKFLKDNVMPEAKKVSDEFDLKIEAEVKKILETQKHWIIQGWLSGFVARHLDNTLRVLVICSHKSLKVDRVVNRDKVTVETAKQYIKQREEGNFEKYRRLYGNYDFWDPQYYHAVIDTYAMGQLETVGRVLDLLGYDSSKINIRKK